MIVKFSSAHRLMRLAWLATLIAACLFSLIHFSNQLGYLTGGCRDCQWQYSLGTKSENMGSQGTASRLRRIVSQLRALLTPNHQGAEGSFLLTSTAVDLQSQLSRGEITSELLVLSYLDQIEKHNRKGLKLHALTSVADKDVLLARARHLDQERREGKVSRGPLHGIPIIIKVRVIMSL